MRRTRLNRGKGLERGPGPKRKTRLKPVNRDRKRREFARCYGSVERVKRMKRRPCDACGRVPTEDALNETSHIEREGMGRKASWRETVTHCPPCHRRFHALGCDIDVFDAEKGCDTRATAARLAVEVPA